MQRFPILILPLALAACQPVSDSHHTTAKSAEKRAVAKMVADEATRQIGFKWVPVALKIAKVESGFNCASIGPWTRHGHAYGVMQTLYGSAVSLGYSGPAMGLLNCEAGIKFGVLHMARAIESGATTIEQMAAFHVGGRIYPVNAYARSYVRMVINANP